MKHTLRTTLSAIALSLGLFASAHAKTECPPVPQAPTQEQLADGMKNAKDRGALWRISKDGRTSYLFGTLHVGQMAWAFPGPKLMQALRETQVLAVEVDITAPTTQAEMQTAMAQAGKVSLSEKDQARLDAQADAACIPRTALASMHPVMQAVTYVVLSGRHDGLDAAYGQEPNLIGFARAQQRPVVSLESIASQMAVLLPREPEAARKGFDSVLTELEKGKSREQLRRISDAWVRGDLDAVGSLEKLCQCQPTDDERAFSRRLNDDRNPTIAQRIAEEHAKGKPVLAAVGLLHMTGPKAVDRLLAEQGFEVQRVAY
ncbi:MAG: TraB/GumN family protein [Inhella sp.]|jgi:uncharacterized protein YbaP (TraB family)|uniref:TraB/GumN family protein n=1 Tax=Inhella sp. TaxID=1921806 RepID=UPI0022C02CBC|nr:TraB/GumN family protein [Inhella sp.]MCZ8234768.1 TraB/GumN family protein [Inhella sp.]